MDGIYTSPSKPESRSVNGEISGIVNFKGRRNVKQNPVVFWENTPIDLIYRHTYLGVSSISFSLGPVGWGELVSFTRKIIGIKL